MPIEIMRARSESSDKAVVVGTLEWSPDAASLDYQTNEPELAILLDEILAKGTVVALSSIEIGGAIYDGIGEEVDVTDLRFISGLDTFLAKNSVYWIRVTA